MEFLWPIHVSKVPLSTPGARASEILSPTHVMEVESLEPPEFGEVRGTWSA